MNVSKIAARILLGRRLATTNGEIGVSGLTGQVTVRRDRYGIPHVDAACDDDAWFALGFCHGQDRAFQVEILKRMVRGTIAALVGAEGIAVDRLSRRMGFRRSASRQLETVDAEIRSMCESYVRGVNAGLLHGAKRPAHEFAVLRRHPEPIDALDVLGIAALQGLFLSDWDAELVRLKILTLDGADALRSLDGPYPEWLPVTSPPGTPAGKAIEALEADLEAAGSFLAVGGGSNNWALAPHRTATGRPILANDPHLAPVQPPHWYLAHIRTPEWEAAGASLVGLPGFMAGHNRVAAWGLTATFADNADLAIETLGPDGHSVRRGQEFVPCEVLREVIEVRGHDPVLEEVLITPDGPIIGPALEEEPGAVSIRATWLQSRKVRAALGFHLVRDFDEMRATCHNWPMAGQNVVYADTAGTIGWQFASDVPTRRIGFGVLPLDASLPEVRWGPDVAFDELPYEVDPDSGWIATANNKPTVDDGGPFLGVSWLDGYRVAAIGEALAGRDDWDVASTMALQMDVRSLPWREVRSVVLAAPATSADAQEALRLLRDWDGQITARSTAAAVFECFAAEMSRRVAAAKAPRTAAWVIGKGLHALAPHNSFWHFSRVVRLLRDQPQGWFENGWGSEIADALAASIRQVRRPETRSLRSWGELRPLTFRHLLGARKPLDRVFNLGPIRWRGDSNTISQTGPGTDGESVAWTVSMRMVIDVGNWGASRFSLPGGQSGNPMSRHYDDLLEHWIQGTGVPIAWTEDEVLEAEVTTLQLRPVN